MNYLDQLNPSQRDAVTYNDGPSLVIAGAGSGKTRVLTYKVAHLLEQGIPAQNILALTFTNKAAREMKERIIQLVGEPTARYLMMGTFHSICSRILRTEAQALGYTHDYTVYDAADSKSLIKALIKEQALDDKTYKPNVVLARISEAKNHLVSDIDYALNREYTRRDARESLSRISDLYHLYQLRLAAANAMDFDDLLLNMCVLFRRFPDRLRYYQSQFRYILVDEYQDTNYVQFMLVKQLAEPDHHICVVGDDAQSIYSFRGADIRNILSFQNTYANARLFKLERNYRSTQTIVKAANSLIHHNEQQIYKEVYSEKELGEKIQLIPYVTDREEALGVARTIQRSKTQIHNWDDVAVLYRTNAQSRAFENELRKLNIPYRIYGGTSFYQRKEVKDAIAYFRLVVNPLDNEALLRVINFPARGIGDTTLKKVSELAIVQSVSMLEVVTHPQEYALNVNRGTMERLHAFASMIQDFTSDIETKDAFAFADEVLHRSNILSAALADTTPEGIERKQNLDELLSGIHEFVQQRTDEGIDFTPIQDFLAEVSLLTDQDEHLDDHTSRVTLMTIHAAKGLEFPHVYIVGLEENLFPSQFCTSDTEIEEERRLLYVAMTRAMNLCTLTYAGCRFRNGSSNMASPSRFIRDIDRQYIQSQRQPLGLSASQPFRQAEGRSASQPFRPAEGRSASQPFRPAEGRSASQPFASGDRVYHRVFGLGTVQRMYHDNGNDKIDIHFDTVGPKTLLLTFAKLEKR